jgi:hypothetical protein
MMGRNRLLVTSASGADTDATSQGSKDIQRSRALFEDVVKPKALTVTKRTARALHEHGVKTEGKMREEGDYDIGKTVRTVVHFPKLCCNLAVRSRFSKLQRNHP